MKTIISSQEILDKVRQCSSKKQIHKLLNISYNGIGVKTINNFLKQNNTIIDSSKNRIKYKSITKLCPVCNKEFIVKQGHPKQKKTCSYACSNKKFRSGKDNGNWSEDAYRTTCFNKWGKKCCICQQVNIVQVHHYDQDHSNNHQDNLVPVCPTHHQYIHSRYKNLIFDKIQYYLNNR